LSDTLDINKHFDKPTLTDWISKINTDLKGPKTAEEIQYLIEEGLSIDAIQAYTGDETRPAIQRPQSDQAIVAAHIDTRSSQANKQILDMLNAGLNAVILDIYPETDYTKVLDSVILDYIQLVMHSDDEVALDKGVSYFNSISADMSKVYHPKHNRQLIHIPIQDKISDQISDLLSKVYSSDAEELLLIVDGQTNFLSEVAKHRAIHILIANLAKAQNKTINYKLVSHPKARQSEVHELIQSTYMALAATLGQADGLVAVANDSKYQLNAVHISNLMSMEAHVDKVNDPAAGSDLIEKITDKIVQSLDYVE